MQKLNGVISSFVGLLNLEDVKKKKKYDSL